MRGGGKQIIGLSFFFMKHEFSLPKISFNLSTSSRVLLQFHELDNIVCGVIVVEETAAQHRFQHFSDNSSQAPSDSTWI